MCDSIATTAGIAFSANTSLSYICAKYRCELIANELDNIIVRSSCGHTSCISPNKFTKHKIGVYCHDCLQAILLSGSATCFKCADVFVPATNSFLYCGNKCMQSRGMTDERKEKIRMSLLQRNVAYKNDDGTLKPLDEIKKIKNKRKYERVIQANVCADTDAGVAKRAKKVDYEDIKLAYKKFGCQLLTTEDEYTELKSQYSLKKLPFRIISSCGHPWEKSLYYSLIESKTGVLCADCIDTRLSTNMRAVAKNFEGNCNSFITQKKAISIVEELCSSAFVVKKTREGCYCEMLVKPIGKICDEWLKIKIKATSYNSSGRCSNFRIAKTYKDVIIIMVDITSKDSWLFHPEELLIRTYYMGKQRERYQSNYITNNMITVLQAEYDKHIYNSIFDVANTPVSQAAQLEYCFVKKREEIIKFLDFKQNDMSGLVYNFKIGKYKVQENTFSKQKGRQSFVASLNKNCGGGVLRQPYFLGDNDFYWLNLNDISGDFYVIPEQVLIIHGYVATEEQVGHKYLTVKIHEWLKPYKFNYNTINEDVERNKLIELIGPLC